MTYGFRRHRFKMINFSIRVFKYNNTLISTLYLQRRSSTPPKDKFVGSSRPLSVSFHYENVKHRVLGMDCQPTEVFVRRGGRQYFGLFSERDLVSVREFCFVRSVFFFE